jgi:hypothetical protein
MVLSIILNGLKKIIFGDGQLSVTSANLTERGGRSQPTPSNSSDMSRARLASDRVWHSLQGTMIPKDTEEFYRNLYLRIKNEQE